MSLSTKITKTDKNKLKLNRNILQSKNNKTEKSTTTLLKVQINK